MGVDPAAAIDSLVEHALSDLAGAEDQRSRVAGGVGIRLSSYVSTRTFELAVHRLDIARAAGVPFTLRHWTCQHAVTVANRVAVDVQACGCNQTDPAAVAIVGQIVAKLADR